MERWTLPKGWEWRAFTKICQINPRRRLIQRNDRTPTSFVPMQAVDEMTGAIVDVQIRPYGEVKRGYTYFEEDDVLMAKITPSMENGKAAIARNLIDGFGFGTTEFHVFRPYPATLPKWIFYFIRREAFREIAKKHFKGAVGQQRVPEEFFLYQAIPLPHPNDPARSLAEQRRIVARLEALLGETRVMRERVQIMRRLWDEFMQAALAEMFESTTTSTAWGSHPLGTIAPEDTRQIRTSDYPEQTFNYWGLDAIGKNQFEEPAPNYVLGSEIEGTSIVFDTSHVLYCKLRPYLNKVIIPSVNGVGSTEWIPLKPDPQKLDRKYLGFVLRTAKFSKFATEHSTGARMPRARKEALREFPIPLPYPNDPARSLAEQRRIVARLEALQAEVDAARQALEDDERRIAQMEQAILTAAFRGEL